MRRSTIVGMAGSGQSALSTSVQYKKRKRLRTRAVTQNVPEEQASEYEVTGTVLGETKFSFVALFLTWK